METYKNWSRFDKNYNASVMKLKKSSIIVIPPGAQDLNWKSQPDFFKFFHCDSVPLILFSFARLQLFLAFFVFVLGSFGQF